MEEPINSKKQFHYMIKNQQQLRGKSLKVNIGWFISSSYTWSAATTCKGFWKILGYSPTSLALLSWFG